MAGFVRFFALNGATALAACGFASRLDLGSRAERLLAAAVLAVGIANASGLVLGILGYLHYYPLLGTQLILAAAGAALARWSVMRDFVDLRAVSRLEPTLPQRLALAALAVVYLYVVFLGWLGETFAGDELMYHLPLVAEYARGGAIVIPELGRYWGNRLWAYYPGGAYLLYQWFVLPFGNGTLLDLVQLPYALASALASYVLARLIGAERRDALWAPILFLAVPIVINQAKTVMVDLTLTFLFAAGLAFLLREKITAGGILLAAIAWGAAPAVKLPAMMFIGLGAACVALTRLDRDRTIAAALRVLVPAGAAIATGAALFSGYWFVRNFLLTGSAIYPLNLHPEPPPAWTNIIFYGLLFPILDFSPATPLVFNYETGAGPQFVCLAVPALIAYGIDGARRRRLFAIAFALLPILAYFVWLLRLSTSVQTLLRYVLPAMPLGFAAFAWMLPRLAHRSAMTALAVAAVAFSILIGVPHVGTYTNTGSLRAGIAKWRRGEKLERVDLMGSVDLQDYRRAWTYIDHLPGRQDIAASHLIFSYPLMGADFRHRLHFPEERDPEQWMKELRDRHVGYVALAELVDVTGRVDFDDGVSLSIDYSPATDESLSATCKVEPREVEAIRVTYRTDASRDARLALGVNRFERLWELPRSESGQPRTETIEWKGTLRSLDAMLDFTAETSLRSRIEAKLVSIELKGADGHWSAVPISRGRDWEVLPWPLSYYWVEAHPERFKLVMRDVDTWRSPLSGELRLYQVVAE